MSGDPRSVDLSLTLGQRMYLLALLDEQSPFDWGRNRAVACRAKLLASLTPAERLELNRADPDPYLTPPSEESR